MKSRDLAMVSFALALSATITAPTQGFSLPSDLVVPFNVSSDAPEGVLVFHVTNPNGLFYYDETTHSITDYGYDPFHIAAVNASGGIRVHSFNWDASAGFVADGDDAVYAGAGPFNANAPPRRTTNHTQESGAFMDFHDTEGWLVFVWKRQGGPWEFRSLWREGTTIDLVATGTVDALSHKDLKEGTRAGLPPALVAIDDGVTLETPGGQTFGWVTYLRSDYFGYGELAVTHEGVRHSLDLTQYPTPDDHCYCGEEGRWMFTSHDPVQVEYDAVQFRGDGALYVLAMHLPADTLPDGLWREKILWPRNTPIL